MSCCCGGAEDADAPPVPIDDARVSAPHLQRAPLPARRCTATTCRPAPAARRRCRRRRCPRRAPAAHLQAEELRSQLLGIILPQDVGWDEATVNMSFTTPFSQGQAAPSGGAASGTPGSSPFASHNVVQAPGLGAFERRHSMSMRPAPSGECRSRRGRRLGGHLPLESFLPTGGAPKRAHRWWSVTTGRLHCPHPCSCPSTHARCPPVPAVQAAPAACSGPTRASCWRRR